MPSFNASKIVSALPAELEADTVYYVRVGTGFDLYCTDTTGSVAHKVNGGSSSVKILATDTSGNLQYVHLDNGTIKRIDWTSSPPTITAAQGPWADRATLTYS